MRVLAFVSLLAFFVSALWCQDEAFDLVKKSKECLDARKVGKGLELVTRAIAINPNQVEAYHLRARIYINIRSTLATVAARTENSFLLGHLNPEPTPFSL